MDMMMDVSPRGFYFQDSRLTKPLTRTYVEAISSSPPYVMVIVDLATNAKEETKQSAHHSRHPR